MHIKNINIYLLPNSDVLLKEIIKLYTNEKKVLHYPNYFISNTIISKFVFASMVIEKKELMNFSLNLCRPVMAADGYWILVEIPGG